MNTNTAISILRGDKASLEILANCRDPLMSGFYEYLTTGTFNQEFSEFLTTTDLRPSVPLFRPCSLAKEPSHLLTIIGASPLFKYESWMNPNIAKQGSGILDLYIYSEIDYDLRARLQGDLFFEILPCPEFEKVIMSLQKGGLDALSVASTSNKAQLYIICKAIKECFPELSVYLPILERNITLNTVIQIYFNKANISITDIATFFNGKIDQTSLNFVQLLSGYDFTSLGLTLSKFATEDFDLFKFTRQVEVLSEIVNSIQDAMKCIAFITDSILKHYFLKFALELMYQEELGEYTPEIEAQVYFFYPKNKWIERFILTATHKEPFFSVINQRSKYIQYNFTDFGGEPLKLCQATRCVPSHVSIHPSVDSFCDYLQIEDLHLVPVSFL